MISHIATHSHGTSIEMAQIGREACTGIGLVLGHPRQINSTKVQLAGTALKLPATGSIGGWGSTRPRLRHRGRSVLSSSGRGG